MNKKITSTIKNTNEQFKKATKAEKRVMIAKDVLAQLKSKRYTAENGVWVSAIYADDNDVCSSDSVQTLFADKIIEKCYVCALGGLFMSCTNLGNTTTIRDFKHEASTELGYRIFRDRKLSNGLNNIFNKSQLKMIEKYFEGGGGYFSYNNDSNKFCNHVTRFYEKYTETQRLKLIMENIVANNGTFVPKKLKI